MKSTIDIAKECGCSMVLSTVRLTRFELEAFRKAVEADFVSRCVKVGHFHPNPYHGYQQVAKEFEGIDDKQVKLYTLPTITE